MANENHSPNVMEKISEINLEEQPRTREIGSISSGQFNVARLGPLSSTMVHDDNELPVLEKGDKQRHNAVEGPSEPCPTTDNPSSPVAPATPKSPMNLAFHENTSFNNLWAMFEKQMANIAQMIDSTAQETNKSLTEKIANTAQETSLLNKTLTEKLDNAAQENSIMIKNLDEKIDKTNNKICAEVEKVRTEINESLTRQTTAIRQDLEKRQADFHKLIDDKLMKQDSTMNNEIISVREELDSKLTSTNSTIGQLAKETQDQLEKVTDTQLNQQRQLTNLEAEQAIHSIKLTQLDDSLTSTHEKVQSIESNFSTMKNDIEKTNLELDQFKTRLSLGQSRSNNNTNLELVNVSNLFANLQTFDNSESGLQPYEFIEQIKSINELTTFHWVLWKIKLTSIMKGEPLLFFKNRMNDIKSLDEFIEIFLDNYWSIEKQQNILADIIGSTFCYETDISYISFVTKMRYKNSHLSTPLTEIALISILVKKLPYHVQNILAANSIKDFRNLMDSLQRIQAVVKPNLKRNPVRKNNRVGKLNVTNITPEVEVTNNENSQEYFAETNAEYRERNNNRNNCNKSYNESYNQGERNYEHHQRSFNHSRTPSEPVPERQTVTTTNIHQHTVESPSTTKPAGQSTNKGASFEKSSEQNNMARQLTPIVYKSLAVSCENKGKDRKNKQIPESLLQNSAQKITRHVRFKEKIAKLTGHRKRHVRFKVKPAEVTGHRKRHVRFKTKPTEVTGHRKRHVRFKEKVAKATGHRKRHVRFKTKPIKETGHRKCHVRFKKPGTLTDRLDKNGIYDKRKLIGIVIYTWRDITSRRGRATSPVDGGYMKQRDPYPNLSQPLYECRRLRLRYGG